MLRTTRRTIVASAALAALGLASEAAAQEAVKIGVIYPLSGNSASAGNYSKMAIEVGADVINNGNADLAKVLPLDKFTIANGEIAWEDLGTLLNRFPPAEVSLQWHLFDNTAGTRTQIAGETSKRVPQTASAYTCLTVQDRKRTSHTIDIFLRHGQGAPQIVGVDRHW